MNICSLIYICLLLLNWITVVLLVLFMHRSPTGTLVPLDLEIEATLRRTGLRGEGNYCKTEQLHPFLRKRPIFLIHHHLIRHHQGNPLIICLKLLPWQMSMTRGLPLRTIQVARYHNFSLALHVLKCKCTTSPTYIL